MKKILIAEDNELNQELLVTILTAHGFETVTANDGEEAFNLAMAVNPELVLMDIQMPGTNGYEAFELLKGDDLTSSIPVIAVTGNAMPHDLEKIRDSGFHGTLNKPFKIDDLLSTISLVLAPVD